MKRYQQITALTCAISLLLQGVLPTLAADTTYRQLPDYAIFNGSGNINWCGGENLEVNNARIPIDSEVTCAGTPSLRVNVTDASDWWTARLVVRDWMSFDVSPYLEEGSLSFDVKGSAGSEQFQIGFADHTDEDAAYVSIDDYAVLTTDWQHVSIPLRDIAAGNPDMDCSDITLLYLVNDGTTDAQTFWLTNLAITSTGLHPETPPIKVNQVGFAPTAEKYALVFFFPELYSIGEGDGFAVRDAETEEIVYSGQLQLLSDFDERDSGERVLKADFSTLSETGRYYVTVEGLTDSVSFSIQNGVYADALTAAQRYFYYQRQGIALDAAYAGAFARDDLGIDDTAIPFASGRAGTLDAQKGWFDAGDFGKYVNTGAGAVSTLLWAYEMYPELFSDGSLQIPESGNGIPDLLDEARWELEWILTMQDVESGGFYPRVQGDAGERMVMDKNGCTTDDTACAVGVLAEAYLCYRDWDAAFAETCLAAAEAGWVFLEANPACIAGYDVYTVTDDVPDRLWAAGALYRATGNASCKAYFEAHCTSLAEQFEDSYAMANRWGCNWLTGCWHYLLYEDTDAATAAWLTQEFAAWREILLTKKWENNIWGVALHKGNYFRGSISEVCWMAMGLSITDAVLGIDDVRTGQCAVTSLSWTLGANPLGLSFVSGCGAHSIRTIYSQIYEADGIEAIPPGYVPQGPNYSAMKKQCQFAAKCYMDSANDWVTNEHTVYGNAALVYLLASVAAAETPVLGDVNADGSCTVLDAVMLQKWLLGAGEITDWQAGDLCRDGRLNGFDLAALKRLLLA